MKPVCLDLSECNGLGDLICATPAIKVLSNSYCQKITILSKMPELFKNNPSVMASYKSSSVDMDYFREHYIMHNSFYNVGKKNERGIEMKHNRMDLRQFHAVNLGFMLDKTEMECVYLPTEDCKLPIPEKYVLIHPASNWPSRTWSKENWRMLAYELIDMGFSVVAIGKDSSETGFFNVEKPIYNLDVSKLIDYTNQTSISDCWHLISKSICFITMDSGLLHLAGTTDAHILMLGSSINPLFRMPYRYGSQKYKLLYAAGSCKAMCASDMRYGVQEWGNIQGVPPLIGCLEKREKFDCHPTVSDVLSDFQSMIKYGY